METIFRICAGLLFEFLLYGTAKIVLPIISFGKVQAKEYKELNLFDWPMMHREKGILYLGLELGIAAGFIIWFSLSVIILSFVK